MRIPLLLVVFLSWYSVECYKILCVLYLPSRSHYHLGKGIVDALLGAGHEVTWVTSYPELVKPQKNLRLISLPAVKEAGKVLESIGQTITPSFSFMREFSKNITRLSLESELREVVVKEQFDAVVTEWFFSEAESAYAAIQQVPWILLSSVSVHANLEEVVDEVRSLATVPEIINMVPMPMTMWQRTLNFAFYGLMKTMDCPTLTLLQDLQDLMDSSNCVVYFSMGSVVQSSNLPEETRASVLDTLGKLPCVVLWKFETDLQGAPKNVHIRKWMPQSSVLVHPNLKLFITHGGLLSFLEALHAGVPLLAIPVFGDQPGNAHKAVMAGIARKVEFARMAQELEVELNEILKDDRYYQRAQYLSKLFKHRLVPPKTLIAHYIELAIESKGAFHLRSPSKLYTWYQRWMLDVLFVASITLYLAYILVRFAFRVVKNKLCSSTKQKVKTR